MMECRARNVLLVATMSSRRRRRRQLPHHRITRLIILDFANDPISLMLTSCSNDGTGKVRAGHSGQVITTLAFDGNSNGGSSGGRRLSMARRRRKARIGGRRRRTGMLMVLAPVSIWMQHQNRRKRKMKQRLRRIRLQRRRRQERKAPKLQMRKNYLRHLPVALTKHFDPSIAYP